MGEHTPTPGPWTTRADGWQPWEGAIQILGPDGQVIAYTSAGTNEKVDAPLLAAAPALVKALEFFADGSNWRFAGPCDPNSGMFRGTQVAREALAQVRP